MDGSVRNRGKIATGKMSDSLRVGKRLSSPNGHLHLIHGFSAVEVADFISGHVCARGLM